MIILEKPYKIQEDLMKAIYKAIEHRKIGIFESPTGTGKSKFKAAKENSAVFSLVEDFIKANYHVTHYFLFLMIEFSTGNEFSTAWLPQFADKGKINHPFLFSANWSRDSHWQIEFFISLVWRTCTEIIVIGDH